MGLNKSVSSVSQASQTQCEVLPSQTAAELHHPLHRIHLYPFYTGYIRSGQTHAHTIKPLTTLHLVSKGTHCYKPGSYSVWTDWRQDVEHVFALGTHASLSFCSRFSLCIREINKKCNLCNNLLSKPVFHCQPDRCQQPPTNQNCKPSSLNKRKKKKV